jgi:hypothetical protein
MLTRTRKRLLSGVTASVLATTFVVPGAARPAQAAVDPSTVVAIIQFASAAFQSFKSSQNGGLTLEQATSQIINAVNTSRDVIIAHADALAVADATACVRHHILEFADIESFPLSIKQRWAQDVTACVTLIDALWSAVAQDNYSAKNELGILLGAVGPIALIARAQARFSTTELTTLLVNAFTRVRGTLGYPSCTGTFYGVSEEFWLYHNEPVVLAGSVSCFIAWDRYIRDYVGGIGDSGYFTFQGGALIDYDYGPLMQQSLQRSAGGVANAALAQLQS